MLGYDRRQVFDLPSIKECRGCGTLTTAEFLEEVRNKGRYGPCLRATVAYIKSNGLQSYKRAAELFEDLFEVWLSCGTLVNILVKQG